MKEKSNLKGINEPKKSHQNEETKCVRYDRFSVCIASDGKAFLVDNDVAEIIKHRKWAIDNSGYLCTNVKGKLLRLHELVMEAKTAERPKGSYVDHINHDKLDNRIINLRYVLPLESSKNMPLKGDNTSGYTGVSRTKNGRYRAYITNNKKRIELGYYSTAEEAWEARLEAEERFGFLTRPKTVAEKCNIAFLCELEGPQIYEHKEEER